MVLMRIIAPNVRYLQGRCLWGWLNTIFNKVDESRIQAVGPDRACAEWLLRCGAAVKWTGAQQYFNDYNSLPPENVKLHIKEIDATDSAIMGVGFPHLRGLKHLERFIIHKCMYVEDSALQMLGCTKGTLKYLQVSSCGNVTVEGIKSLHQLTNLKSLLLYDLPEIRNKEECLVWLKEKLPQCEIEFPYALASEQRPKEQREE